MHYDHISFHIDENYPPELPHGNALHHMAHYYAWAVSQNLHSAAAAALPGFAQMQRGETPAAQFVERQLAQGLDFPAAFGRLWPLYRRLFRRTRLGERSGLLPHRRLAGRSR